MTDHKFTDELIIRCLNECDGKENAVAYIVDQGEGELVTLGRILEIVNRQADEIKKAKSEAIMEFTEKMNKKMGKHTAYLGKEYVQRIMREIKKEMTEDKP